MKEENFVEKTLNFSKNLDVSLIKDFIVFDDLSSTNLKAKELAQDGKIEGTVVISKTQSNGRGRFNRVWESPEGGLYFSIILRPRCKPDKATLLPLFAALSVCKTITSICDLYVKIKWPNDVLINGKKVCGILLESESSKDRLNYVVLGFGINLNVEVDALPNEFNATSISREIGIKLDCHAFLKKLLLNLSETYTLFVEKKYGLLLKEWKVNSDTIGKQVCIDTPSGKINGKAVDIDQSGFLMVTTGSGEHKKITSGDCFYIK